MYLGRIANISERIKENAPKGYKYFTISTKGEINYLEDIEDTYFPNTPYQELGRAMNFMRYYEYHAVFIDEYPEYDLEEER